MKKLTLDVDALRVETFDVAETADPARGTVEAAQASVLLSGCASCRPSGPRPCFNTETCC
jgi:hypothetical protein